MLPADAQTVNNLENGYRLQVTSFDKKSYGAHLKQYMGAVKAHLEKTAPERVADFMKGAQNFAKKVLGNFSEYEFFTTESMVCILFPSSFHPPPHFSYHCSLDAARATSAPNSLIPSNTPPSASLALRTPMVLFSSSSGRRRLPTLPSTSGRMASLSARCK